MGDLRELLQDLIASAEADMADDWEDAQYTGERPDLAEYEISLTLTEARAILAALNVGATP